MIRLLSAFVLSIFLISSHAYSQNLIPTQSLAPLVNSVKDKVVTVTSLSSPTKSGEEQMATGTGFIVDGVRGLIVTNNHVIAAAVKPVTVHLESGKKFDATVVGADAKTDIALLKINSDPLPETKWGDSDKLSVGDPVMAIGNPFGLTGSVSYGIVSALHRDIDSGPYDDLIQTDAAINKGNSGGPLFNMQGEVVGMNSEIISPSGGSIGLGFSIPSNEIASIIQQLYTKGHVTRGYIGVTVQTLTDDVVAALGLSDDNGALVSEILKEGPAGKTTLQTGDVIVAIDGIGITSIKSLPKIVANLPIGKTVNMTVIRHSEKTQIPITIAELPPQEAKAQATNSNTQQEFAGPEQKDGLAIDSMKLVTTTKNLCDKYKHTKGTCDGALVINLIENGPADVRGVKIGDVITGINQNPVNDIGDVIKFYAMYKKTQDTEMFLQLESLDGSTRFVVIK